MLASGHKAQEASARGLKWSNPYHLGWAANWKESFDVEGPCWGLAWLLPAWHGKRGNGYVLPLTAHVEKDAYLPRHGLGV